MRNTRVERNGPPQNLRHKALGAYPRARPLWPTLSQLLRITLLLLSPRPGVLLLLLLLELVLPEVLLLSSRPATLLLLIQLVLPEVLLLAELRPWPATLLRAAR